MTQRMTTLYRLIYTAVLLFLSGCEAETTPDNRQIQEAVLQNQGTVQIGTPITEVTGTTHNRAPVAAGEYAQISWDDLQLPGHGLQDIVEKYQFRIDLIPEGSPAEEAVMEEMQAELNATPVNPEMNNQKIKLPGFISPLDIDERAMVTEFLLVPYFGACIHTPPPPLSQTVLVIPDPDKSVGMERIYEPVWVSGTIKAESITTDLADAGYQIVGAAVEMYQEP